MSVEDDNEADLFGTHEYMCSAAAAMSCASQVLYIESDASHDDAVNATKELMAEMMSDASDVFSALAHVPFVMTPIEGNRVCIGVPFLHDDDGSEMTPDRLRAVFIKGILMMTEPPFSPPSDTTTH